MQELFDAFRHILILLWAWAFLPCIFSNLVASEKTEIEFRAFRLQQYENVGKLYGSKSWKILYEAVSFNKSALRKCVIVNWRDLIDKDLEKSIGAAVGAVLVIIPENLNSLSKTDQKAFLKIEKKFSTFSTEQALYFVLYSEKLNYLLKSISLSSAKLPTAFQQLYNAIAANSYQISSENTASSNTKTTKQYNIIGQLHAGELGKPYLFIVAHYDSHAAIPALGKGVDSNGSGVAALLELLAILSQFYSTHNNRPKYNVVFVLSAAGKFNYQGSRQWIEDFQENNSDAKIIGSFCFDGLARGDSLYFHVSKALTENSAISKLYENLRNFASDKRPINVVVKKINLLNDRLAWEHEIYNVRRIHGATISHFSSHSDFMRNSILDDENLLDIIAFESNVKLIVNAVVSFLFNLNTTLCQNLSSQENNESTECSVVGDSGVNLNRLLSWLDLFGSSPRSIATLSAQSSAQLIADFQTVMQRYADKVLISEVSIIDFDIYGIIEDKISASIVKPAVFELFLAAIISVYLFGIYVLAQNMQTLLERAIIVIRKIF